MKLVSIFNEFLSFTVNLNDTRVEALDRSAKAIETFVASSDWAPPIQEFVPQGSWAHHTIIKPVDGGQFDADLLVFVSPVEGWTAADYVTSLGKVFKDSKVYGDKTKVWSYCVTVTYAGEHQVDIAPCVVSRNGSTGYDVCNRHADSFEQTSPKEYTEWLKQKNGYSGSNSFRKVTRLLKYLRDIKTRFTCSSILLTTLIGTQINFWDQGSEEFIDVPTTLKTLIVRLDDWLQGRPLKPKINNPVLPDEDLAASLTEEQYANFRNSIHRYRNWIVEAYDCSDRTDSIAAWRRLFGDDFAKGVELNKIDQLAEGAERLRGLLKSTAAHLDGVVEVIKGYGIRVLPATFFMPPHMELPKWPSADHLSSASVAVIAAWSSSKDSVERLPIRSGDVLPPKGGIWFDIQPEFEDCEVHWRITNTGIVALSRNNGRGGFYHAHRCSQRWERLEYRGVHIAEAFVVRSGRLVVVSEPFLAVIE